MSQPVGSNAAAAGGSRARRQQQPAAAAAHADEGRSKRQRKAKVFEGSAPTPKSSRGRRTDERAAEETAAPPLPAGHANKRPTENLPIESYGQPIDRILAWRWKDSRAIVHHTADGSITAGGDGGIKAPFEGKEEHLHIEKPDAEVNEANSSAAAAAAAAASSDAAPSAVSAAPSPSPSPLPSAKSAAAAAAEVAPAAPAVSKPALVLPPATSAAAAIAAIAPAASAVAAQPQKAATASRKKKDTAQMTDADANAGDDAAGSTKKRGGRKRKAEGAEDAAAADAAATAENKRSRKPKFAPVSKQEALAAFQRTLLAARESAGLSGQPESGVYTSKARRAANREAAAEEEDDRALGITDADLLDDGGSAASPEGSDDEAGQSSGRSSSAEGSSAEDEEDEEEDSDDSDARTSKRRKTTKGRAAASGSRKKPLSKAAKKAAKKSRAPRGPSAEEIRATLLAEHGEKEFFVTLKRRSYLHAKWVDIYAFLPPPPERMHEKPSRAAPVILTLGLPLEGDKDDADDGAPAFNTGALTQLRVKLLRFLKATPLPISDDDELYMPDFVEIDRILARKQERIVECDSDTEDKAANKPAANKRSASRPKPRTTLATFYLIKWSGLPYSACTWEHSKYVHDDSKVSEFEQRQRLPGKTRPELLGATSPTPRPPPEAWTENKAKMSYPDNMPQYKGGNELRPHQIDSVNWLNYNWYNRRGSVLADEMGLGKTVSVVAHILHVRHTYARGPFLVIVPLSTLPHWKREFDAWTSLNAVVFQGSKQDRDMVKQFEWSFWANEGADYDGRLASGAVAQGEYKFDVLLATYESILSEPTFLSKIPWRLVAIDEAHRLKNLESRLFKALQLFRFEHRVLLTGTPIQNNLDELWTLLHFVDGAAFPSLSEFQAQFGVLEKNEQVKQLQAKLAPYLLRRMKEDVARNIPGKEETVIHVELTDLQKKWYRAVYEKNRAFLYKGCKGSNIPHLLNVMIQLRKVCSHPFLLPGVEEQMTHGASSPEESLKMLVAASGKLVLVDKLLPKLQSGGHRVLIFSQMKMILDLLEYYCKLKGYVYERIDGSIRGNDRQAAIDRFSRPGSDRFIFMLSTRAGGLGINLVAADTVIIFDSDWNPQQDLQAMARCHRIGQRRAVKVYRLVTRGTYEMDMFKRASMKMGLDQAILKKSGLDKSALDREDAAEGSASTGDAATGANALSALSKNEVESLLRNGAYALLDDPASAEATAHFLESSIEDILLSRSTVVKTGGNDEAAGGPREASTFSQAVFASEEADTKLDVHAVDFWEQLLPDERSAQKLTDKMLSGAAYATAEARRQFMEHLEEHVQEIAAEYQQGTSLKHVPLILEILRVIASQKPDKDRTAAQAAAAAAAAASSSASGSAAAVEPVPMDEGDDEQKESASAGAAAAAGSSSDAKAAPASADGSVAWQGWTRDQIRQAHLWHQELLKPRRQRKVAERYTDLGLLGVAGVVASGGAGAGGGGGPGQAMFIESAFKRRLYGRALNGMGGVVFTRKQRKSLSMAILDLAGVLPWPGGAQWVPDLADPSFEAPSTDAQMKVWTALRSQVDPSVRARSLPELMGWSLSFVSILLSMADGQDVPVYQRLLDRLQACVPTAEELARLEAAESRERRKNERHTAIKLVLAQQLRQKIALANKRETAAAAEGTVKTEPDATAPDTSAAPSPAPSSSVEPEPASASAVKSEPKPSADASLEGVGSFLDTDIGQLSVEALLAEEGEGNSYTSSGKRIGRPATVGLSGDTATLPQMQPRAARLANLPEISTDDLRESYDDAQEEAERREEEEHYARFERSPLRVTLAHFPSLSEDQSFVLFVAKRSKRWARFIGLASSLRAELDLLGAAQVADEGQKDAILRVAYSFASEDMLPPLTDRAAEELELQVLEGSWEKERKDKEKAPEGLAAPAAAAAETSASTAMDVDSGAGASGAVAPASSPAAIDPMLTLSDAQKRVLSGLSMGKGSFAELRTLPGVVLARLLRRTALRPTPMNASMPSEVLSTVLACLHLPEGIERAPSWWWRASDDVALLHGLAVHGMNLERISRSAHLPFRHKLADRVFEDAASEAAAGGGRDKDEDDDATEDEDEAEAAPAKKGSPTKSRRGAKAAAAAAQRQAAAAAVKEEDADAAAASNAASTAAASSSGAMVASANAAGQGCVCHEPRYGRGMGRTKVCTCCLQWFHMDCLFDDSGILKTDLRLDMFSPLPLGHPLARGLGSVAGPPGAEADLAAGPMKREQSERDSAADTKVKEEPHQGSSGGGGGAEEDESDTASEEDDVPSAGASKRKRRGGRSAAPSPQTAPSMSQLRDGTGFRCPRCSLSWPGPRLLELRLRTLVEALARVRRTKARAKDRLLRAMDETYQPPVGLELQLSVPTPSRGRGAASGAGSAAAAAASSAEKHSAMDAPARASGAGRGSKGGARAAAAAAAAESAAALSDNLSLLSSWSKKDRHEFLRALQMWGIAFFTPGGYHAGVPLLTSIVIGPGGESKAMAFLRSHPLLGKKSPAHLRVYFELLRAQLAFQMERHRRDTAVRLLRRRQAALHAEHRELAEARARIDALAEKVQQEQSQYCFCGGVAVRARAQAASRSRRRRPNEFLVGCDSGASAECKRAGSWFHGLCLGFHDEAQVPETFHCPYCVAHEQGLPAPVLSAPGMPAAAAAGATEAAAAPMDTSDAPAAAGAAASSSSSVAPLPPAFESLPLSGLFGPSSLSELPQAALRSVGARELKGRADKEKDKDGHGEDSGSDSDGGGAAAKAESAAALLSSDQFRALYAELSQDDLEDEYAVRVEQYLKESAALRADYAALRDAAATLAPLVPAPIVDESVGHYLAYRVLNRLSLFAQLRDGMALGADAVQAALVNLEHAQRNAPPATSQALLQHKMPDWWSPPVHDWALLRSIFSHGLGAVDPILADPGYAEAFHPNLGESYSFIPWCHAIVSQSSGAKVVLRREMEKFLANFLADRAQLNKRLTLLANWLTQGQGTAAEGGAAPAAASSSSASSFAPATSSTLSLFVSSSGKALEGSRVRLNQPTRLPLLAILDAKLSGRLPSSEKDRGEEYDEEGAGAAAAAAAAGGDGQDASASSAAATAAPRPAKKARKVAPPASFAEDPLPTDVSAQAAPRKRSISAKKKFDDGFSYALAPDADDTSAEERPKQPRKRKESSSALAQAGEAMVDAEGGVDETTSAAAPQAKKKPRWSGPSASKAAAAAAAAAAEDAELSAADEDDDAAAASSKAKPRRVKPLLRFDKKAASGAEGGAASPGGPDSVFPLHTKFVSDVRRDPATGRVLPFGLKGGVHVLSLGTADLRPAFHKGSVMFPVGFTSTRPYHSVANPDVKTNYTSRVLVDPSAPEAPYFTVIAADDPDTVWSGHSPAACWTAICAAAHQARGGGLDTKTGAVNGLEYFGISSPIVKALLAEQLGANAPAELLEYLAQNSTTAQVAVSAVTQAAAKRAETPSAATTAAAAAAAAAASSGLLGPSAAAAPLASPAQVAAAQAAALAAQAAAAAANAPVQVEGQTPEQQAAAQATQQKRATAFAAVAAAAAAAAAEPIYPGSYAPTLGSRPPRGSLGTIYPPYLTVPASVVAAAASSAGGGGAGGAPPGGLIVSPAQAGPGMSSQQQLPQQQQQQQQPAQSGGAMSPVSFEEMLRYYAYMAAQQQFAAQQQQQMAMQQQQLQQAAIALANPPPLPAAVAPTPSPALAATNAEASAGAAAPAVAAASAPSLPPPA